MKRVCNGNITSPFGMRKHPITGKRHFHNGVDIACPIRTEVYAPQEGVVTQVYHHPRGGLTLIYESTEGLRFGFCHLESTFCNVGSFISAGAMIAHTGNSGVTTGAHLHYTQSRNGVFEPPTLMIKE